MNTAADDLRINAIRFLAVDAVQKANSGHPGLPLGAAPAAYALWTRHLRFNPADTHWFNRDRFVLSAGHGSALLYALLHLTGYDLSLDDLEHFRQLGSRAPGHPEYHLTPGVEVTTGPLGQGFANGVGLAIAEAHLAAVYNREQTIVDHHTYVLAGDGDLMEGIASEAASLAGHLALGKLIVLYDDNKVSLAAATDVTFTEDVRGRFEAYGWHTIQVGPGEANDADAIDRAITEAKAETLRPTLIAIRSTIGYGSPEAGTFKTHGEPLGKNMEATRKALHWDYAPFVIPDEPAKFFKDVGAKGAGLQAEWNARYDAWKAANPQLAAQFERARDGKLPAELPWPTFNAENGSVATREAGGTVMNAIAAALPELVGGSADLDPSTKTNLKGFGDFQPGSYAGRNIHFGVREHAHGRQHERDRAARRAAAVRRDVLQLRRLPQAVAAPGRAQQDPRDLRVHARLGVPGRGRAHAPADRAARDDPRDPQRHRHPPGGLARRRSKRGSSRCSRTPGPTVIVLTRQKLPYLGDRDAAVARGAYVLGNPDDAFDLILIASGSEVSLAVDAAKVLAQRGTKARVVSMPSWKLFDAQDEAYRHSVLPPAAKARMSIEAAATLGWSKYVGDHGIAFGLDHFGTSAPAADIAKEFGFTPEHVADVAAGLLANV